jgi:hypothetical protein
MSKSKKKKEEAVSLPLLISELNPPTKLPKVSKPLDPKFIAALTLATILFWLASWYSTGSMAVYNITCQGRVVQCNYMTNVDHSHHGGVFLLLNGADRPFWETSVVLRRVLYAALAYPMAVFVDYFKGGVFVSILCSYLAFLAFVLFVRKYIGQAGAYTAMALLLFYPGIYYWVGSPYVYSAIFPCCLLSGMALYKMAAANNFLHLLFLSLFIGILALGYDILPFVVPAVLIILWRKKNYLFIPLSLLLMVLPSSVWGYILANHYKVSLINSNTKVYSDIISGYLNPKYWNTDFLVRIAENFIPDFATIFFTSNFIFLPALFLIILLFSLLSKYKLKMEVYEYGFLGSVFLLFAFINCCPRYDYAWNMSGTWIARLYQPAFVGFAFFIARYVQQYSKELTAVWRYAAFGLIGIAFSLNFIVVSGTMTKSELSSQVYYYFYKHGEPTTMIQNLNKYGHYPLGTCP